MSALLAHAKALRAIGKALKSSRAITAAPIANMIIASVGSALMVAADDLEGQAKAETTGDVGTKWRPLSGEARKLGK